MKKYTEQRAEIIAFDWNKFLENPPEYLSNEHLDACDLSCEWVTCACGNLCDIIPRSPIGRPYDTELESLGIDFDYEIKRAEWQKAKETLEKIEKRSEEIIFELIK
jgi:hypothetical protein